MQDREVLLEVKNLKKHFVIKKDILGHHVKTVHAVDGINFKIFKGETFGLVGESGCGKSTTGRTIIGLYKNTAGEIFFNNELISSGHDECKLLISKLKNELKNKLKELPETATDYEKDELKKEYNEKINIQKKLVEEAKQKTKKIERNPRDIQMIFQDPYASLNPRMTVNEIIAEGIKTHKLLTGQSINERVYQLLERVGLKREHASRYPHEFSGGQRQRIGIARALAVDPKLIIADEPISALDVSIQAQVVNMLEDLQEDFGLTYLFIAHDLSMVKYISDRIGVMYLGKLMEVSESDPLYELPLHPYTQSLLSSIPLPDPDANLRSERIVLQGDVSSPINPKPGCRFAERCRFAKGECFTESPELDEILPGRFVACHHVKEINNL
ncbi:MAG: Oligopeptide transport ATP-binding protein OppF [Candidatus Izimaplasma bacterium HR2]|nr:MAG: Oligopeptide transport ATP-binding protein OppF [Candidatus Izimaplasma bacterium HR2]